MKKFINFEMKWWMLALLTILYIYTIGMYFEYFINRNIDEFVQIIVSVIALIYTVWQIEIIRNFMIKTIKTKK